MAGSARVFRQELLQIVDNLDNWAALSARGVREHPKIAASMLESSVGSRAGSACGEPRMSRGE